jgi:F-type H+-transporting ATPase subunit gamma
MPLQTRAIKTKIKTIGNIRKITRAMEMVAASKMRKAVSASLSTREYALLALSLLKNLSQEKQAEHPFLNMGVGNKTLLIVVSSNRGLCGGFNVSLSRAVMDFLFQEGGVELFDFVTVGRYSEKLARKTGGAILASFVELPEDLSIYDIGGLVKIVFDGYGGVEYNRVVLAYNKFISAISYKPLIREILPVRYDVMAEQMKRIEGMNRGKDVEMFDIENDRKHTGYLFEPGEEEVLKEVLPRLVEVQIFQGLLESFASEQSARMLAMKSASDNAGELVDNLTLSFNKARQSSITQEILEVASGASSSGQ